MTIDNNLDRYQLDIVLGELHETALELQQGDTAPFPDLARLLRIGLVRTILQHTQNLIWTLKRIWKATAADQDEKSFEWHDESVLVNERRIFIDGTYTFRADSFSGISRVCRELSRAAVDRSDAVGVFIHKGDLYNCSPDQRGSHAKIAPKVGDIYLIADSYWGMIDETLLMVTSLKERGVRVALLVHDVLPLQYPALFDINLAVIFRSSWSRILPQIEIIVTVSKSVSHDVAKVANTTTVVKSFRLGVRFDAAPIKQPIKHSSPLEPIFCENEPVFLSVGTLEPRKGLSIALDAFDTLWASGVSVRYLIVGRPGWHTRALQRRIKNHPLFGTRLFWVSSADDDELQFAYTRAFCLVQASVAEGFGLPLIEAAHFGLPIIASDIAVFREVGEESVTYFKVCDPADLAEKLGEAVVLRPTQRPLHYLSWAESLDEMISCLTQ